MPSHSPPRSFAFLAAAAFTSAAGLGCGGGDEPVDESVDVTSESVSSSWKCDISTMGTDRCQATLADIAAQATAVGRENIVDRGIWWLGSGVTYDRNAYEGGYRRDCSGFVSMCWEFSDNPSTAYFPPFVYNEYASELGSIDELVPGDALNKTYRDPYGHVMLFGGWASADHQELYLLHHYSTGKPVALIQVSRSELGDYMPIRSVKEGNVQPQEPPKPPPDGCGVMLPGAAIGADQGITSCDGRFTLLQQGDGNLVLYMAGKGPLWATSTNGTQGRTTVMQADGNLVMYTPNGEPVWDSTTWGRPGSWLQVQDDGNVVIYQYGPIWSTQTGGY